MTCTVPDAPVAAPPYPRAGRRLGLGARLGVAILSGAALALAFPPYDIWFLAPVGVAGLVLSARDCRPRRAALLGLVFGLATFLPLLSWMQVIGVDAWVALALLEAAFVAAMAAGLPLVSRLPLASLWIASLWVAQEAARDRLPFGGFPWGRLAFAETASPFTPAAALGGAPLVTWVTALTGALVACMLVALAHRRLPTAALLVVAAAGVPLLLVLVPTAYPGGRPVTVALVQGGVPGVGMDFSGEREEVLRNHVRATRALAEAVREGRRPAPEFVVWPENASDIDPFGNPSAYSLIDGAVRDVDVPVLVGTLVDGPGPNHVRNSGIVWDPDTGPGERYVKRHPVPFGEYIPFRSQLSGLTERLDQIPRDFYPGDRPGVLALGSTTVGDVICFEIAYDGLVRDVVSGGAEVLVVQTNNATYNGTGQPQQQMAMSRLRAVEHGRTVLVTATSGISAVIGPDGSVRARAPEREARTLVATVPARTAMTLATRLGAWPEVALSVLALAAVAVGYRRSRGGAARRD